MKTALVLLAVSVAAAAAAAPEPEFFEFLASWSVEDQQWLDEAMLEEESAQESDIEEQNKTGEQNIESSDENVTSATGSDN